MIIDLEWSAVRTSTDGFAKERILGKGSFAVVYVADLRKIKRKHVSVSTWELLQQLENPSAVAIKVLIAEQNKARISSPRILEYNKIAEAEELRLMSEYHHRNLCCLLGFSLKGPRKCYIYEFCPGGNLHERLAGAYTSNGLVLPILQCAHRLQLAVQIARGIEYLHCSATTPVIHRDIKSTNILVDSEGQAKVADFGTVREAQELDADAKNVATHMITEITIGTKEYMPPEYVACGHVSPKTDAFAFGVVLAELLLGLSPSKDDLMGMLEKGVDGGKDGLAKILDSREGVGRWDMDCAMVVAKIALHCGEYKASRRAQVSEVLQELEIMAGVRSQFGVSLKHDKTRKAEKEVTHSVYEGKIRKFYKKHNPNKLNDPSFREWIEKLLQKYAGREDVLLQALESKYVHNRVPEADYLEDHLIPHTTLHSTGGAKAISSDDELEDHLIPHTTLRSTGGAKAISSDDELEDHLIPHTTLRSTGGDQAISSDDELEDHLIPHTTLRSTGGAKIISSDDELENHLIPHTTLRSTGGDQAISSDDELEDHLVPHTTLRSTGGAKIISSDDELEDHLISHTTLRSTGTGLTNRLGVDYAAVVTEIYEEHNPGKLDDPMFVQKTVQKFQGREEVLLKMLRIKYKLTNPGTIQICFRLEIYTFYKKHNPDKLEDPAFCEWVEELLQKYAGREDVLLQALESKYVHQKDHGDLNKACNLEEPLISRDMHNLASADPKSPGCCGCWCF
jgi:serine/threonine protein kinase